MGHTTASQPMQRPPRHRVRLGIFTALALTVMLWGFLGGAFIVGPALHLDVIPPLRTDEAGRITRLTVAVRHSGPEAVRPRFTVDPEYGPASVWTVISGPPMLRPGETRRYTLAAPTPDNGFYVAATLRAEDGPTHSAPHPIGYYDAYSFPDVVYNADYHLWGLDAAAPNDWFLNSRPVGAAGRAHMQRINGRDALALSLQPTASNLHRLALEKVAILPRDPLSLWIYPTDAAGSVIYGLEIDDGAHRLIVRFAPEAAAAIRDDDLYIEQWAAPLNVWSRQSIDVAALYERAGFPLPELRRTVYRELDVDLRLVTLRLLLVTGRLDAPITVYYGPIEQPRRVIPPGTLAADALDDPAAYYRRLADRHAADRNYHLAVEALDAALRYTPDDPALLAERDTLQTRYEQSLGAVLR